MEIQLQELIEQIKRDGVGEAEVQSAAILESAKAEAERIIANAKAEAQKAQKQAKEENERYVRASEDAIRQAGRNLLISFRESVNKELEAIVGDSVKAAFSGERLVQLVVTAVEAWTKDADADNLTVLLGSKDLASLEEELLAALKAKLLTGVTLKANDNVDGGFRIAVDNGRAFYDYSADAVTEMLSLYLSPKVTSLMKEVD